MKPSEDIAHLFLKNQFIPVPDNWVVVITDVKGSTKAIEEGRYKEVNTAGGLAVMALANELKGMEFPFVFGGDGVTFLMPENIWGEVKDVFVDTKEKVKFLYDLHLRVGAVPVQNLTKQGYDILLGKLRISKYYNQAIITGKGIEVAEDWIKAENSPYLVETKQDEKKEADFEGFTCRWQDVPSHKDSTVAFIVKFKLDNEGFEQYVEQFFESLYAILGSEEDYHPLKEETLKVATDKNRLATEAKAKAKTTKGIKFYLSLSRIYFEIFITKMVMRFRLPLKHAFYELKNLKSYQWISADYRKYDGTLKMVVAVSKHQLKTLQEFLQKEYRNGHIFYGLHITDRALMTCLMHSLSKKEVHFIDAADGGYALAAKSLKQQLKEVVA